ncbi:Serine aminopeptidase, S33 [Seinonella peptonophila]|uniref:Serine aminopeptidase, S33 n=1 Tax=Seinonella peptonophila TaxID=112248 RepID=A0A1M4XJL4_9BACL|nr:alpha/beta fold hydrolase [Seinonella peptonophila]SHE93590.1 Serine aminopeptidase, S33 [Seinonella peptonophila]
MKLATSIPNLPAIYRYPLIILILLCVFMISISSYVLYNLLHPERKPIEHRPESFHLPYQNVTFQSKDGVALKGWLIPGKHPGKKIVIMAHGYGDNRSSIDATLPMAKALYEQGFATLLFDFRNSGEAGGTLTTVGVEEKLDLHAAIQFAKHKGYQNIGLYGFSMGAATAIVTASERHDIQALVSDSAFSDLRPYLEENLPVWSGLPNFFTPIILRLGEWSGVNPSQNRPIEAMKKLKKMPILLIHTSKDPSIPVTETKKLSHVYHNQSSMTVWLTAGTEHVGSFPAQPQEYIKRVTSFFTQYLK